ncbi:MAG: response regulator [Leptospiraceae bacterium]|nr:response regulator [Leptospiraceae bacterium]MDW8305793.1 response regulator [Leptospiraceae bacterium]
MKRILIVDDSVSIRQVVKLTLESAGYEVIEADSATSALNKLLSLGKIHLIISDLNMPGMDGIEFIKTIKHDPHYGEFRHVPIMMLTTVVEEDKKLEGQMAGAKAWLTKPFLPDKLLSCVQKLIGD